MIGNLSKRAGGIFLNTSIDKFSDLTNFSSINFECKVRIETIIFFFLAFRALDTQLDQLNSALDALEEKNDRIHEKAKDLLQSNREVRATSEGSNEAMDQDRGDDSK